MRKCKVLIEQNKDGLPSKYLKRMKWFDRTRRFLGIRREKERNARMPYWLGGSQRDLG